MTTLNFTLDDDDAAKFQEICQKKGITMQDAFDEFTKKIVHKTKGFPIFRWIGDKIYAYKFMQNVNAIRKEAIKNGTADMSMEEIDAEIDIVRKERMKREKAEKQNLMAAQG